MRQRQNWTGFTGGGLFPLYSIKLCVICLCMNAVMLRGHASCVMVVGLSPSF